MPESAANTAADPTTTRIHPWMHWQDVVKAASEQGIESGMLVIDMERGKFPRHHHYYTKELSKKRVLRIPVWAREAVETALAARK